MPKSTPRLAIPYPVLTDAPHVENNFANMLAPIDGNGWEIAATLAGFEGTINGQVGYDVARNTIINRVGGTNVRQPRTFSLVKSATTDRTSTTTFALDPELQFTANSTTGTYWLEALVQYTAGAGQIKIGIGTSGGTSVGHFGTFGPANTAAAGTPTGGLMTFGYVQTNLGFNMPSATDAALVIVRGILVVSAGTPTVGVTWAQVSSSVTNSSLISLSELRVTAA